MLGCTGLYESRSSLETDFRTAKTRAKPGGKSIFQFCWVPAINGLPVQIRYQANWWFPVVLNLLPKAVPQSQTAALSVPRWGGGLCG